MPATRNTRRNAAKRTILGTLDENEASAASNPKATKPPAATQRATSASSSATAAPATDDGTDLPSDFDGLRADTVRILLDDISREVRQRQDAIALLAEQAKSEQQQAVIVHRMKIQRAVRNMTVRDFNAKFGCDILAEVRAAIEADSGASAGKKRDRPGGAKAATAIGGRAGVMDLETPAAKIRFAAPAPGTALRTVRKGEAIFSVNGSPVDQYEEGDLVATVAKKRKGAGGKDRAAVFDIKVGDGRYVNLAEPGTVTCLDQKMKNAALSQFEILQDQMASLVAQLRN